MFLIHEFSLQVKKIISKKKTLFKWRAGIFWKSSHIFAISTNGNMFLIFLKRGPQTLEEFTKKKHVAKLTHNLGLGVLLLLSQKMFSKTTNFLKKSFKSLFVVSRKQSFLRLMFYVIIYFFYVFCVSLNFVHYKELPLEKCFDVFPNWMLL